MPDSNERNPAMRPGSPAVRLHAAPPPPDDHSLASLTNMSFLQTSSRPRDVGGSFASRRGHAAQLSISDPSHHVTEAIGTLYGDDDDGYSDSEGRPVSFAAQPYDAQQRQGDKQYLQQHDQHHGRKPPPEPPEDPRKTLIRSTSDQSPITLSTTSNNDRGDLKKSYTLPSRIPSQRQPSYEGPKSPMSPLSPSLRDVQADKSGSQFPLTHMDNPNDIAQEMHNLQALRRMSMDVGNTSDPDLLPFSSMSLTAIPGTAPQGDDDEGDPSRLLWVPARVHPELDTNAFKNFLENRVQAMKRRSGDSMLSADGSINNTSSLRRKKSMLSRQIDSSGGNAADDYVDGADRLQRKGSQSIPPIPEVSLDELVKDPSKAVQKLARDTQQGQDGGASESGVDSDMILPSAPGMGLRRSTRTTYRKGGSLRGERVPFSKRISERKAAEPEEAAAAPPVPAMPPMPAAPPGHGLTRVQSEPVTENFSRPSRSVRRQQNFAREAPAALSHPASELAPQEQQDYNDYSESYGEDSPALEPQPKPQQLPYRTSSALAQRATPVPQIVETPPPEESSPPSPTESSQQPPARQFPERSSSQKVAQQMYSAQPEEPPARSNKRPTPGRPSQTSPPPSHLTFIPTMNASEDKKLEKKKDTDAESIGSTKSSGWPKWFKSDEKEKKKKEKEKEEQAKKAKAKGGDKSHDNARLDVLQSSIDNVVAKGRESLLLDRESIDNKLTEERKKESTRKASDSKKEKEGFFGGLFGGSKKKSDKEPGSKKKELRPVSPEPPSRPLRPDIDYPWSRFTIIEERAIYRMAHIKLANPRRSLQSQVLLSNFMYSYLAKVQAMHPQIQVPVSPQQKRLEEERKRKEAEEQRRRMEQQQREAQAQQDGNFDFEYHRVSHVPSQTMRDVNANRTLKSGNQYGDTPQHENEAQYIDDSERYAYDHQTDEHGNGNSRQHQNQNGGAYHSSDGYDAGHSGQGGDGVLGDVECELGGNLLTRSERKKNG
ncbi:hypothetical protein CONLIGDRAFT_87184 [Coniochaeta ligniaria NRRL 30616]|uniref:Protein Zds1 C-terminal domain-containing protein n=1 Tax=Coniochaeta ligniaria NRRL 30616 TaxID=1408157 RepID=A0A1J7J651_9PEZI|nr:hypothetical protein CONLIGDRAFT_87184 [Coniochaeta ligniaria NRRL 30616]